MADASEWEANYRRMAGVWRAAGIPVNSDHHEEWIAFMRYVAMRIPAFANEETQASVSQAEFSAVLAEYEAEHPEIRASILTQVRIELAWTAMCNHGRKLAVLN
jgi:hypothetical protein